MRYRVYDTLNGCWIKDNIFLSPNGELYMYKRNIFGIKKLFPVSELENIIHREIDLNDVDGVFIFEGDYLEAHVGDDRIVTGLVVYAEELSSYIILCDESEEFFVLGNEVSEHIRVIGNVFDGIKEEKRYGQSTLQETEV